MSWLAWFMGKPAPTPQPAKPFLLHRWYVDVTCVWEGDTYQTRYEVIRHSWDDLMGDWCNEVTVGRFETEREARDFIERNAHLPQAFDVQKSFEADP